MRTAKLIRYIRGFLFLCYWHRINLSNYPIYPTSVAVFINGVAYLGCSLDSNSTEFFSFFRNAGRPAVCSVRPAPHASTWLGPSRAPVRLSCTRAPCPVSMVTVVTNAQNRPVTRPRPYSPNGGRAWLTINVVPVVRRRTSDRHG